MVFALWFLGLMIEEERDSLTDDKGISYENLNITNNKKDERLNIE